jgi:hypothetical protein
LPSGKLVALDAAAALRAAAATSPKPPTGHALAILRAPGVLSSKAGDALPVDDLPLSDFHVLMAVLARSGLVHEAPRTRRCDNCGEPIELAPSVAFEIGPFVDGELDDPELDAPFDFTVRHSIPAVRTASGVARDVLLAPRTVHEARRLLEATKPLAMDRSVVAALGIRALGPERQARELVSALEQAGEDAWSEVLSLVEDAHYAPRMFAEAVCARCGARNTFPVPADRELDWLAPAGAETFDPSGGPGFPTLAEFESSARGHVAAVFARRGLRNIDVVVDDGVPYVDAGGSALLGCYTPGDPLAEPPIPPEIRVFYRTFAAEHRDDPGFDVERELEETIDHEAQHHLHHLEGEDPMDDGERDEIAAERARIVGKSELGRRATRALYEDVKGFVKVAFPLLLLLLVLALARYCD